MKIKKLYLIAMGTLLSANAFSKSEFHDHTNHDMASNVDSQSINIMSKKIGETMFVCPMHPEIVQPEMGSCPICGMDLVKKSHSNKTMNEVTISQGMQQNLNIKTKKAKMKRLTPKIKSYGKIKYNEDSIKHYHVRVEGWIENSMILNEGQYIKKGEKLFELYSEELIIAQQDLILTSKSKNTFLIKKAKKRLELLGINKKTIDEILKTKEALYTVPFYAESSGIVKNFNIRKGMFINPTQELFSIVNTDSYWIDGFVFDDDKNLVTLNSQVEVKINSKENIRTKVDYIYPELDLKTLSLKYRVTIDNDSNSKNIKPNSIIDLELYSKNKIIGLFIPIESLIQTENENRVVVKTKTGFVVKEVLVGFKNDSYAQILKGLSLNEEVVTSGQFLIDSEASILGAIKRIGGNNE
jgi:Cu(I)/Ag(I) efflux system membrane fusion protein